MSAEVDLDDEAKLADEHHNIPLSVNFEVIRRDGEQDLSCG